MGPLKGAFLSFGAGQSGAPPNIVVFQFNPETVTRTPSIPQPPPLPTNAGASNAEDQPCLPGESISFSLRLDASEQLAQSNPIAAASGILPTLSALELLMIPQSSLSINLFRLSGGGCGPYKFPPTKLPSVLFFWGPYRILPVAITSLSITETEYDPLLNPVRSDVSVSLQVLIPQQLAGDALATGAYNYSLGVKLVMAALNLANAAQIGVSAGLSFST
jgi:hypothetical protein